ncbi:hypothetical protein AB1Y20_011200 [Prymnesium parvum]|uniref:Polyprenyl synthetase family protein n=1 Tax=Prymnesium parvum TaxID=97485 RepID=A0AB34IPU8_PRYPA
MRRVGRDDAADPRTRRCGYASVSAMHVRRVRLAAAARQLSTLRPVLNDHQNHPAFRVEYGQPAPSLPDPYALVSSQLRPLDESLSELIGNDHPVLTRVAHHFFELAGKRFRPTAVLLAARAANGGAEATERQVRLAEITEMIHAASHLHNDVHDGADGRRGTRAASRIYGNKVAVLAGDFLLARASVFLSRLRDCEATGLIAQAIEESVHGELMHARAAPGELLRIGEYVGMAERKTAALVSLSCRASALVGGHSAEAADALQLYGRHLGVAYQLIDDLLDFGSSSNARGEPALSDVERGLATAPTLFALEEFPEIADVIHRRFADEGDAALITRLVQRSDGVKRTQELATSHARAAAESIGVLAPSRARDGLLRLCADVLNRES